MKEDFIKGMARELGEIPLALSQEQMEQFYIYYEMLAKWNQMVNLTAIIEMDEVIVKHFVDSLALVKAVGEERLKVPGCRLMDVGTGAGFPGLPLKIAFPDLEVTLLDSLNKRIKFLNELADRLGLSQAAGLPGVGIVPGTAIVHGRAEDYGRDKAYRETYDLCVSRAVAHMSTLSEYCLPFVRVGGCFVSYKSGKIEEELGEAMGAVEKLGGKLEEVVRFTLGAAGAERALVKIRKVKAMDKRYPRKAGMPGKEPLA